MSLAANVSLIVATLDLQLVRLIRGAMRTADLSSGAAGVGTLGPAATFENRRTIHPEPRYENRRVIHPTPRFETRPIDHAEKINFDCSPCSAPCAPDHPHIAKSRIQPPWEVLPWQNPPPPAQVVKVAQYRPDNVRRGALIDCFI